MDPIEYSIIITIAITVFEISNVLYSILNFFILTPLFGMEGIVVPTEWSNAIIGTSNQIAAILLPIYILLIVFYIIMYIIYLIIIYIIPPTGFATLFIPIREILLKIPPLPSLINYGVFKLFDRIINALGLSSFKLKIITIIGSLFDFSRENIKRILIILMPNYADEINNYNKEEEEKKNDNNDNSNNNNDESEIYKQIEQDKNICISQNTELITPDNTPMEKIKKNFSNLYKTIDCEGKAIGNYIKSNK